MSKIITHPQSREYDEGWERTFRRRKVSEVCREDHVQNCTNCDDLSCGDNMRTRDTIPELDDPEDSE